MADVLQCIHNFGMGGRGNGTNVESGGWGVGGWGGYWANYLVLVGEWVDWYSGR